MLIRAVECKLQLEETLARLRAHPGPAGSHTETQKLTVTIPSVVDEDHATLARSKVVLPLLVSIIQSTTTDPDLDTRKAEEMLVLNDDLTVLIRNVEAALGPG